MTNEQDDRERAGPYLAGTVQEAWARCLPLWSGPGRVNDFPRGIRRPRYLPSFATILGRLFVERFAHEGGFLLDRLEHGSAFESLCAFDLLDFLGQEADPNEPLPDWLGRCALPLPAPVRDEVEADWIHQDRGLDTVGKLLSFDHEDEEPPDD